MIISRRRIRSRSSTWTEMGRWTFSLESDISRMRAIAGLMSRSVYTGIAGHQKRGSSLSTSSTTEPRPGAEFRLSTATVTSIWLRPETRQKTQ